MDQLLWIGCLENEEEFKRKVNKGYNLASAQVAQKSLLNGIEQTSGKIMDSINGSVLPPYPIYKDRNIETVTWSHTNGAYDITVGYKNDIYVNRINCKKSMITAAKKWIKERYQGGTLTIFVYSMRSAPMATANKIKQTIPKAKIYLIVTDLPQFMDLGQNRLKAFLKKIDWIYIKKIMIQFDGFILYSAKMAEFLNIQKEKWILMEGCYDVKEITENNIIGSQKAIMYSGRLDNKYGIRMLLDAFMQIQNKELELWLTGSGNAEAYISKCIKQDKRIKFFGFLPDRKSVLAKQQKATLLINMRLPSEPASDYCFPSKLFEYMSTGIPVISFKLGGIPEEYYQYLFLVEEESIYALRYAIEKALKIPEKKRIQFGIRAKDYIKNNKTSEKQAKRILSWIYKEPFYESAKK